MFRVALILSLVGSVAPASALAQRSNPLVQQGQQQYEELRYEEALQTLSAALIRADNSREDKSTIYALLAFTYLALGREAEAEGAYRGLLAVDPAFEPDSALSPRMRTFFAGVRERWEADGRPGLPPPAPVQIRHRSPPQGEAGDPIELEASIEDQGARVQELVLAYRRGSEDVFQRVTAVRAGNAFRATIPGDAVAPPLVEYYFEGLDGSGLPVAARGDVAAPLRVAVPEESSSVFTQWWFWVGAAVLVAGAVTAGILIANASSDDPPATTQGTFIINIQ
ncbi:MAG: tetratricopeptide repeat protein [Myxococcota bacterium]